MSIRNVWYDKKENQIHLWETIKGKKLYGIYDWVPYIYVPTKEKTGTQSIFGENVVRKKFKNYYVYNHFQETNDDIYENKVMPEIQFLVDRYYNIPDEEIEIPELKIFSIDIEVHSEDSFPHPQKAEAPITSISVWNLLNNKVTVFGEKEYTKQEIDADVTYYQYKDERELINNFCQFIHDQKPDIVTGWNIIPNLKLNISGFDFPYIINRCINLFGDETDVYKKLSPINKVRHWSNSSGDLNVDIVGISIIDYMAIYKWFTRNNPESYSLEYISNLELGEGKLEYEGSLKDLYHENWNKYVDYNIIDTKRVAQLEKKLGYINLVQTLSLITKTPMKYYQTMTTLIEGMMLTYLKRNNMCTPKFKGGHEEPYEGAYVKEPIKGLHKWIASIDIASSYPTAIVLLNMSTETYVGKITSFTEDEIIRYTSKREFPSFNMSNFNNDYKKIKFKDNKLEKFNLMLKRGLISVAPCGTCFKTNKTGVIANVEKNMFLKRKSIKKKMFVEKDKVLKKQWDTIQNSYKTLINSVYGATAVSYSRYFNNHISEAITACGRHQVKQGEKFVNEILNNPTDELQNILENLK